MKNTEILNYIKQHGIDTEPSAFRRFDPDFWKPEYDTTLPPVPTKPGFYVDEDGEDIWYLVATLVGDAYNEHNGETAEYAYFGEVSTQGLDPNNAQYVKLNWDGRKHLFR